MPDTSSFFQLNHHLVCLPYKGVQQTTLFGSLSLFPLPLVFSIFSNLFPESHLCLGAVQQGPQNLNCLHWFHLGKVELSLSAHPSIFFFFLDWSIYQLFSFSQHNLSNRISSHLLSSSLSTQAWFTCSTEMFLPKSLVIPNWPKSKVMFLPLFQPFTNVWGSWPSSLKHFLLGFSDTLRSPSQPLLLDGLWWLTPNGCFS